MKRQQRAWPKEITEIPSKRPDARADPQATQKISREQLDDALRRTKSGTRSVARYEPDTNRDSLPGPRDTGPEITIVRIDSVELSVFDPASFPPSAPEPSPSSSRAIPVAAASRRSLTSSLTGRLHVTPRLAFLVALAVVTFVTLAAIFGFVAGRRTGH